MKYLIISINVILIFLILNAVYNLIFLKEGLQGCSASTADSNSRRSRGAKREEINSTIRDLKAEINELRQKHIFLSIFIKSNKQKLEKISEDAVRKAERNKEKMDKLK